MREIELTRGYKALVDDEDYEELMKYNWHAVIPKKSNTVYARRNLKKEETGKRTLISMHQHILNRFNNCTNEIDHIDNNGLNNTRANLRVITNQQNMMNIPILKCYKSSKYKGVSFSNGKYRVQFTMNYKNFVIPYFENELEAAKVYDALVRFYYPDIAYTNFDEVFIEPLSIEDARAKYRKEKKGIIPFKVKVYNNANELIDTLSVPEINKKYKIPKATIYLFLKGRNNSIKNLKLIKDDGS